MSSAEHSRPAAFQVLRPIWGLAVTNPVATILLLWLVRIGVMALLQAAGTGIGFRVWPMGEDRNWLGFMMDAPGVHMVRAFWQMNDRNPLSAWWWLAASPIIHASDWGLYFVRMLVDPFLAISTFLLLDRLGKKKGRTFALSVAAIVLVWNFSSYHDQIMWEMLVSLGLSILSIYYYCRYVDSSRTNGIDLGYALVLYFIAVATYTLNCGAILVISLLSLFRRIPVSRRPTKQDLLVAFQDTACFATVLLGFLCIWYTASRPSSTYYELHMRLVGKQLIKSIRYFFWHPDYSAFLHSLWASWPTSALAAALLVAGAIYAVLLMAPIRRTAFELEIAPAGWAIAVLVAIALPIIAVESTSNVWLPGFRSRMVQQVFQPLLYVLGIFCVAQIAGRRYPRAARASIVSMMAVLGAVAVTVGLEYNRELVKQTTSERALADGLRHLLPPGRRQSYFLVKMDRAQWGPVDSLSDVYGRTMLRREDVSLRILQSHPPPDPVWTSWWRVGFGDHDVTNVGVGRTAPVDYRQVCIVIFDGEHVHVPAIVRQEDLAGLQVDWRRTEPISQQGRCGLSE